MTGRPAVRPRPARMRMASNPKPSRRAQKTIQLHICCAGSGGVVLTAPLSSSPCAHVGLGWRCAVWLPCHIWSFSWRRLVALCGWPFFSAVGRPSSNRSPNCSTYRTRRGVATRRSPDRLRPRFSGSAPWLVGIRLTLKRAAMYSVLSAKFESAPWTTVAHPRLLPCPPIVHRSRC